MADDFVTVAAATFSPNFLKFWTLLLISFFLGLFGLLNFVFVFPLLQVWIFCGWIEVKCLAFSEVE